MTSKLIIMLLFFSASGYSKSGFLNQSTLSLGMTTINFTETDEGLGSVEKPASGSNSFVSVDYNYQFMNKQDRSYYIRLFSPFLESSGSGYFGSTLGVNYYFNSISSEINFLSQNDSISLKPQIIYSFGAEVGTGYLVYLTETAKKSDILIEYSAQLSVSYAISRSNNIKLHMAFGQGIGAEVNALIMKLFLGYNTYTFD